MQKTKRQRIANRQTINCAFKFENEKNCDSIVSAGKNKKRGVVMSTISVKVEARISAALAKFQKILKMAKEKDLNESDTVVIISDMLAEVFGYDKYLEVTSELAIKGTYCDLSIKIEDKFQFLIECKSIGTELKEAHLKQVVDYGANKGISWVILTNGQNWELHRIKFEQPISSEIVCSFNFLDLSNKKDEDLEKLFVLCKEGLSKDSREIFYERLQVLNKYIVGAFILQEPVLSVIKREIRKFSPGLKIEESDIENIIKNEVLKRELIEGENAESNAKKVKKYYQKTTKQNVTNGYNGGKYIVNTNEVFYFLEAKMIVVEGNKYIVLAGSKINVNIPTSNIENVKKIRERFKDKFNNDTTFADIEFGSPSGAAVFVYGGAANGKECWCAQDGKKLYEFIENI